MTPARHQRSLLRPILILLALLVGVAAFDDPDMYDPQPGPNAPAYVNWRTGQLVTP